MSASAPSDALVFFGATGDLAHKKIFAALQALVRRGVLRVPVVGVAKSGMNLEQLKERARDGITRFGGGVDEAAFKTLCSLLRYVDGDYADPRTFAQVREQLGTAKAPLHYLAIPPSLFGTVAGHLAESGCAKGARVVVEKPFGHDRASAAELNTHLHEVFDERSVFRIDHYLGKETVQNILAVRFANAMFEPIWNSGYVDNVQITMAEDIGIGGRAGYYDGIGAARDVIQNHLLQLLALTAMEEPLSFSADDVRMEKQKVLRAVRSPSNLGKHTSRGQYASGWQGGVPVRGYLEEDGIPPDSTTETFAALRLDIDTRRWAGVPFYLRTGKRLGRRVTEVAVVFKRAPHLPFAQTSVEELGNNALVFRIQPDEGMTVRFGAKVPGTTSMQVRDVSMDFQYGDSFVDSSPEAYERLILDVLLGDPPLFPRHEEVELGWRILDPVLDYWSSRGSPEPYVSGGWGPHGQYEMIGRDGRTWRRP